MIPVVNLNNNIAKELEMERDGKRRTRRFIGDAAQASDRRWYQAPVTRQTQAAANPAEASQAAEGQPRRQPASAFMARFSSLFGSRRLPIGSKG